MSESTPDGQDQAGQIRDKIAASRARGRSRVTPGSATASQGGYTPPDPRSLTEKTIDEHPLALLAGSLVMGVVAANFLQASLIRRLGSRMLGAVIVAGELGAKAGNKTLGAAADAGRTGQEKLSRLGDLVAEEGAEVRRRAAELGSQAGHRVLSLASEAASEAKEKGTHAGRRALSLASEAAGEVKEKGSHALDRLGKLGHRS